MREGLEQHLVCPRVAKDKVCHGRIFLAKRISGFPGARGEIKEGVLKCWLCGNTYPIYFGIPMLSNNLPDYLRINLSIIFFLSKKYGSINKALVADSLAAIMKGERNVNKTGLLYANTEHARKLHQQFLRTSYLFEHYGDIMDCIGPGHPIYPFLGQADQINPYKTLKGFLERYRSGEKGFILEVGCGVGGFLRTLSNKAKSAFGLDSSFLHLFYASCILKHLPVKLKKYKTLIEGDHWQDMPLPGEPIRNLDLIAAQGETLPFKDSSFSAVISSNVIDVAYNPFCLLKEKIRTLENSGLILCCDPHAFGPGQLRRLKIKAGQTIRERIHEILGRRIKILAEQDFVPRICYSFNREFRIYYTYCFCGRKTKQAKM